MARELTIQIRLSEEEHSTIASQAEREGLAVGTYLRALALRTALLASPSTRGRAAQALSRVQERSKARGLDKLTAEQVDGEIKSSRGGRRRS